MVRPRRTCVVRVCLERFVDLRSPFLTNVGGGGGSPCEAVPAAQRGLQRRRRDEADQPVLAPPQIRPGVVRRGIPRDERERQARVCGEDLQQVAAPPQADDEPHGDGRQGDVGARQGREGDRDHEEARASEPRMPVRGHRRRRGGPALHVHRVRRARSASAASSAFPPARLGTARPRPPPLPRAQAR